jgi:hypothetical protein
MPAVFEDVIAWLWHERRVKHIFLDRKGIFILRWSEVPVVSE